MGSKYHHHDASIECRYPSRVIAVRSGLSQSLCVLKMSDRISHRILMGLHAVT